MKNTILLILLIIPFIGIKAQSDDVYSDWDRTQGNVKVRGFDFTPSEAENANRNAAIIANIQYCLKRYKQQQYLAIGGMTISSVAIVATEGSEDLINKIAGGVGILSFLVYVDSFKWLERASIEPSKDGVTFKFKF